MTSRRSWDTWAAEPRISRIRIYPFVRSVSRNINDTIVIILRDIVDNSTIALSIIDVCCVMMRNRYRKERLDINMLTLYSTLAYNIHFQHCIGSAFVVFVSYYV